MFSAIFFTDYKYSHLSSLSHIYYRYPGSKDDSQECDVLAGFTVYFYFVSRIYSACISHEL